MPVGCSRHRGEQEMKKKEQYLQELLSAAPLSLEQVLQAREQRVLRQQRLMKEGGTIVSFTLNIAGAVKSSPLFSAAFAEGKRRILQGLRYQGAAVLALEEIHEPTGDELCLLTDADLETVKRRMVELEESCPLGRLFDIDVMDATTDKISRRQLGFPPRRCLLCGESAAVCARSQAHPMEKLMERTVEIIWDFFSQQYAHEVASHACRALLYEVTAAPKPGLVDRCNNGSHRDMTPFTFIDSACVLYPYFRDCALRGIEQREEPQQLFAILRCLGKEAEDRMRHATNGVNTHKGAIFSMGIFCAAAGMCSDCFALGQLPGNAVPSQNGGWEFFSDACRRMCVQLLDDFSNQPTHRPASDGEKIYRASKITGIRGQAAAGFPAVFSVGLPALWQELAAGKDENDAGVAVLLRLIACVEDTNIVARSDEQTLRWAQQEAQRLASEGADRQQVERLDAEFIRRNISPGGCADLLALCYFCHFLEDAERLSQ